MITYLTGSHEPSTCVSELFMLVSTRCAVVDTRVLCAVTEGNKWEGRKEKEREEKRKSSIVPAPCHTLELIKNV